MAMPGIVIRIGAETKNAIDGINRTQSRLDKFGREARSSGSRIAKGLALGAAGAAAAAGLAVGKAMIDGVAAAVEDQTSQAKLANALKNTVGATEDQVAAYEDYITAAQKKSGMDDGKLRAGNARLLRSTKNTTRAQQLSNTAMEIAAATGKDYESVANALAKAEEGNTTALKKLGITVGAAAQNYADLAKANKKYADAQGLANQALADYGPKSDEYADALKKVKKAGDDLAKVKGDDVKWLAEVNTQFAGSVAAEADTYAGKVARVATAWGELQEAFGTGVLDNLGTGNDAMGTFDDTLYELQPTAENIGAIVAGIADSLAASAQYIGPVVDKLVELNNMGDGILTNGVLVNTMKAINGDYSVPGLVRNTAPGGTLTPAQLAAIGRGSPTTGAFYDGPGYVPMSSAQRGRDAVRNADSRSAVKDARTRQNQ